MPSNRMRKTVKIIPISDKWIVLLVIIGVIVFFIIDKYQASQNKKQDEIDCHAERNREIKGKIKIAFLDDNPDHKGFVIQFTNGQEYRPRFLPRWQSITFNEGDSINKEAGTFKFTLFKNGIDRPIVIEDTVNCDALK